jgi:predicted DNA-binding transcriptional regulator AlpA
MFLSRIELKVCNMSPNGFLTSSQLSERYQRTQRTLARWIKNPPDDFPRPIRLNGRNLRPQEKIENWERQLASKATRAV